MTAGPQSGSLVGDHGEGGSSMRTVKIVVGLLMAGMMTLSALPAQAGGGAGGGGTSFVAFQCYLVTGADKAGRVVNLTDQFGTTENVRVERARMLCTPTTGELVTGELDDISSITPDHVKCYSIIPNTNPNLDAQVTDQFGVETLEVKKTSFLCMPAGKELVP